MDATGPRLLFDLRSLSMRHRRPAITVPPEARIGSIDPRRALMVAWPRLSVDAQLFSISRDVEQGVVGCRTDDENEQNALSLAAEQQDVGLREPPHA